MSLEDKLNHWENRAKAGIDMFVFASDIHIPYENKPAIKLLKTFIEEYQPETLILGGDIVDMYSVSSYSKDPSRAFKLQREINKTVEFLEDVREILPESRIVYLEGNHENRLQRWLLKNPDLYGLDALTIPSLLFLEPLEIEYKRELMHKNFLFTHGDYVNKYQANKELEVKGVSGMSGHKHTRQHIAKTTRGGTDDWTSVGHLSNEKKAEYVVAPNWQIGFGVVYFQGKDHFAENIPILKGNKIIYEGREISE